MVKKLGANSIKVRQINRNLILEALMDVENANISEVSSLTGLSIATCANILPELVESGEATELLTRESSGGRPARRFAFNPNHTLIASFLVQYGSGRPEVIYTVSNAAGATVFTGEESLSVLKLEHLDAIFESVRAEYSVKAVAVAIPGVVQEGVIHECDVPDLVDVRLGEHIRERYGLESVIDNDMNFSAVGYHKSNAGISAAGLVFLAFPRDHCPGCGLVVNGMLVRGKSNYAGEISAISHFLTPASRKGKGDGGVVSPVVMGRLAAAVSAVVNPDVVVVSGEAVEVGMHDAIRAACGEVIPERHMPGIVVQPSYERECFIGMQTMALNRLSLDYKLVRTDAAWC